ANSDGVLVAHENCRKFYKCSFGVPVAIRCASNLLYDYTVERCEWPETVECGDRPILEDSSEENTEGEWVGNGAGNDDPSQAPAICAAEGSDNSYVAH
ncbi:chitin binding domain-containing protein, partial [Escherichia coli]|nr:chitin binding domain-containing protein [Escherichia coli]